MRPSWDRYFSELARSVATRATCDRAHVGCVLVLDREVLATGYNGAPRGLAHCDDEGHLIRDGHCVRTVHAETNAVVSAARRGVKLQGCTAYLTHTPCLACTHVLINAGVVRVVTLSTYRPDPVAEQTFARALVPVESCK